MTVTGLNHVSVTVQDLDRSLRFYHELLDLPLLGRGEIAAPHLDQIIGLGHVRLRWAELDLGAGQILELFHYLEPTGKPLEQRTADPGSTHLALNVTDIHQVHARLTEAGVTIRSDPVQIPSGDWAGAWSIYTLDPDGVTVELVQDAPTPTGSATPTEGAKPGP
jgi:catechol 2,3-dioxygenase-like lactoylglutathione lyase family enzyme